MGKFAFVLISILFQVSLIQSAAAIGCGPVVAEPIGADPLVLNLSAPSRRLLEVAHPLSELLGQYRAGLLTRAQFATAVLQWETESDFEGVGNVVREPLLQDGHLTPLAQAILGGGERYEFSESERAQFAARLAQLPESEHTALAVTLRGPVLSPEVGASQPRFAMLRSLVFAGPCRRFLIRDRSTLVVPSFGVLQLFLDIRYGNAAIQMEPEFGASSRQSLLDRLETSRRPFGLGYPGLGDPGLVDGVTSGWLGFSLHDYFHAAMGSEVPPVYRRLLLRGTRLIRAARLEKNWLGRVTLVPGWRWNYHKAQRTLAADYAHGIAVDMNPHSRMTGGVFSLPPTWGEHLLVDYGPVVDGWSALFVRDAVKNPDWYRGIGIDPDQLISELGPDALRLKAALTGE